MAVIDIERSEQGHGPLNHLDEAVRRYPDRLWVGGHLASPGQMSGLLEAGARGVLVGSSLFADGRVDRAALRNITSSVPPDRLMVAVDSRSGHVVSHGFTKPTSLRVDDAIAAVIDLTGGRCAVLQVETLAAAGPHLDSLSSLRSRFPEQELWYAGGLRHWPDVRRVWKLGCGAVVGRHYLNGDLGLADAPAP